METRKNSQTEPKPLVQSNLIGESLLLAVKEEGTKEAAVQMLRNEEQQIVVKLRDSLIKGAALVKRSYVRVLM